MAKILLNVHPTSIIVDGRKLFVLSSVTSEGILLAVDVEEGEVPDVTFFHPMTGEEIQLRCVDHIDLSGGPAALEMSDN